VRLLLENLRYGLRMFVKKPAFTFVVVVTLALGIGANTAIFSVVNAVLLRPLPFPNEKQLIMLQETREDRPDKINGVSYLNFTDWQNDSKAFARMAIVGSTSAALTDAGEPARLHGAIVSADLFRVLDIAPQLGRAFDPEDDVAGAKEGLNSVMLTDSCWRERFQGNAQIIGQRIKLDEEPFVIVGVTPAGIFPLQKEPIDYWITVAVNGGATERGSANASRSYRAYRGVIGRLNPGVSVEQAQTEMDSIALGLRESHPDNNKKSGVRVTPLRDLFVSDARSLLLLLPGIVGLVLLIACANVANLLLARATSRHREIAIRAALGATRWQIVQQLLVESLMAGFAGGLLGLLFSVWGVDWLAAMLPADVPRVTGLAPDWRVLSFTFGVSLLTGALCGIVPAISASKTDLAEAVKEGGRGTTAGKLRGRLRNALVVAEVALAVMLLVGAGLLIKSLLRLQAVNPGFATDNVLTAQMVLASSRYSMKGMKPDKINAFLGNLNERIKQLPGVREVSFAQSVPLTSIENNTNFNIVERPFGRGEQPVAQLRFIGLNYFKTIGISQSSGRDFTERDDPQAPPVVIVNEAFVREYLDDDNPLGKRLTLGWGGGEAKEIVGVVGNVLHRGLNDAVRPEMYVPQAQFANAGITLLVRSSSKAESLIEPITAEVRALDSELPLTNIKTLEQYRSDAVALPRFNTWLLSLFAALAFLLTTVGLYSVISYSVTQRTNEIGIRVALGASARDILKLVIGQGLKLTVGGVALGLLGALALTRLMKSMLFEVSATDPTTFVSVAVTLTVVAILACWLPGRRAAKVDPAIALRHE